MSTRFSADKMDYELTTRTSLAPSRPSDETPFRIVVLGDFSGRANRGVFETGHALAARRLMHVDVDNLDGLPGRLGVELHLPVGGKSGPRLAIRLAEMDDFHPDRIFDRLEVFQALKDVRERLGRAATFSQAAAEVRAWAGQQAPAEPPASTQEQAPAGAKPAEGDADMLQRLLGKRPVAAQPPARRPGSVDVDALIREAVRPYIVPAPDPQQAELISQVDQAVSGQMREILRHPDFQGVESAWRGVQFLVSRLETDETLKLFVLDVSKAELAADLASEGGVHASGLYRLLAEQSVGVPGAEPWAILAGCYSFDQTAEDVQLLGRIAQVARAAGAPFVAAAGASFAGCASLAATPDVHDWTLQGEAEAAKAWQALRGRAEASCLGLVLPRFLLRLPYGPDTEPVERFDFQELPTEADHEAYLWGNPALVCVQLLGMAFRQCGWDLTGAVSVEADDLPMHVYQAGGETRVTPCAETFLTERAMQALIERGLMPLLSIKGRNAARLPRFQSVADPVAPLAGRWR